MGRVALPWFVALATMFLCANAQESVCGQELSKKQQDVIKRIKGHVDEGSQFFKKGEFGKSASQIRRAIRLMTDISSDGQIVAEPLKNDYNRIVNAKRLLEQKGQAFEALPDFETLFTGGGSGTKGSDTKGSDSKGSDTKGSGSKGSDSKSEETGVSFVSQVAPILVKNCAQCHIDQNLGRYSAKNYNDLRKKSRKGVVVKPGDIAASRLISLVESGAMPKGGNPKLKDEEIEILKKWVAEGAKFDGDNSGKRKNLKKLIEQDG